jgi:hypothetical protein
MAEEMSFIQPRERLQSAGEKAIGKADEQNEKLLTQYRPGQVKHRLPCRLVNDAGRRTGASSRFNLRWGRFLFSG